MKNLRHYFYCDECGAEWHSDYSEEIDSESCDCGEDVYTSDMQDLLKLDNK